LTWWAPFEIENPLREGDINRGPKNGQPFHLNQYFVRMAARGLLRTPLGFEMAVFSIIEAVIIGEQIS
jgi:hypothetical protein